MSEARDIHASFLIFQRGKYFWWSLILSLGAIVAYILYPSLQPANGGTGLGYVLGTVAALLILWLLMFGARKRAYISRMGSVQGWLSAHVYLGVSLLLLTTLHAGFQLGWNIHSLCYWLVWIVVGSGMIGTYGYYQYPRRILALNQGSGDEGIHPELAEVDRQLLKLANTLEENSELDASHSKDLKRLITSAIGRTQISGSLWQQLTAKDYSQIVIPAGFSEKHPSTKDRLASNKNQKILLNFLGHQLANLEGADIISALQKTIQLVGRRASLLIRLRRIIQLQVLLKVWLQFHVPLSFALLATLIAHIASVFLYW